MSNLLLNSGVAVVTLQPGEKVAFTTAADGTALIERMLWSAVVERATMANAGSASYGPYLFAMTIRVTCTSGSVRYSKSLDTSQVGSEVTQAAIAAAGAVLADGSVPLTGPLNAAVGLMLPTADPLVAGVWWDNAGTLTKSAGP